jgi:hypothetical protein
VSLLEFVEFQKIPRLKREIVITEKIDGTNAQVFIRPRDEGVGLMYVRDDGMRTSKEREYARRLYAALHEASQHPHNEIVVSP